MRKLIAVLAIIALASSIVSGFNVPENFSEIYETEESLGFGESDSLLFSGNFNIPENVNETIITIDLVNRSINVTHHNLST